MSLHSVQVVGTYIIVSRLQGKQGNLQSLRWGCFKQLLQTACLAAAKFLIGYQAN